MYTAEAGRTRSQPKHEILLFLFLDKSAELFFLMFTKRSGSLRVMEVEGGRFKFSSLLPACVVSIHMHISLSIHVYAIKVGTHEASLYTCWDRIDALVCCMPVCVRGSRLFSKGLYNVPAEG